MSSNSNDNAMPQQQQQLPQRSNTNGPRRSRSRQRRSTAEDSNGSQQVSKRGEPVSDSQTIKALRTALTAVSESNPDAVKVERLMNTIKAMERRIDALTNSRAFTATTAGFNSSSKEIAHASGLEIPCSTLEETVNFMNSIISGAKKHPKRLGWQTSGVYEANSQNVVKLTTASGFVDGMQIFVAAPTHLAHRGVYVIGVDMSAQPGDLARWTVLAYVPANRDVEDIGSAVVDLFTRMRVALPSLVAGTSTAVVSQILMQMAVSTVSPMAVLPGKLAYVSTTRKAPIVPVGPEPLTLNKFNDDGIKDYLVQDGFDTPNDAIVAYPRSSIVATNSISRPTTTAVFSIQANVSSENIGNATGFVAAIYTSTGVGYYILPSAGTVTYWRLRQHQEAYRHMLTGDFRLRGNLPFRCMAAGDEAEVTITVDFVYAAGNGAPDIIVAKQFTGTTYGVYKNQVSFDLTTAGDASFDAVRGLLLRDINIDVSNYSAGGDAVRITTLPYSNPTVELECLTVPARATYLISSISNALNNGSVSVDVVTHSEVKIDLTAKEAKFLAADESLPADPTYIEPLSQLLTAGQLEGDYPSPDEQPLSTSGLSKVFKRIKRGVGKAIVQTARGVLNGQDPVTAGISGISRGVSAARD
jgi:hypothetical protein